MAAPWTREEVEAVVADYFTMLALEFQGRKYNKAAHLRALLPKLNDRNKSSVEFKRQNISAVLYDLGFPWIPGYKPMPNYQQLLFDVVAARLSSDATLEIAARSVVEEPAVAPPISLAETMMEKAPELKGTSDRSELVYQYRAPVKRDYFQLEERNRSLGAAGEVFVVEYERRRLDKAGKRALGEKVDHIAATRGDGLGYDVLSYDRDGRERFIEVKTTAFDKHTPFYLSRTELAFSKSAGTQFRLYRLFEFRKVPRMFELVGAVDNYCQLYPATYLARFG